MLRLIRIAMPFPLDSSPGGRWSGSEARRALHLQLAANASALSGGDDAVHVHDLFDLFRRVGVMRSAKYSSIPPGVAMSSPVAGPFTL
jgi:hypothetical protein